MLLLIFLGGLTSCKTIDLRTDYSLTNKNESDEEKGKRLLEETYLKMGYDKFKTTEVYAVNSYFDWKMPWSMMPMNSLPGNKSKDIQFKFSTNTFDGQLKFLEGGKVGEIQGLQSWETYVQKEGASVNQKDMKRQNWGLATYSLFD
ncbi:MAG: hypothetical protein AB8G22_17995 [Saprospiraceae bacterium]